jgi:uncharacterized protein (TIGR03437 family)
MLRHYVNFPAPTLPVVVGVGNIGASVLYAVQAPYLVSDVAQIKFMIPTDAPTGAAVPHAGSRRNV